MQLADIVTQHPIQLLNNPDGTGACGGEWKMGGRTTFINFKVAWEDLESFMQQVAGVPVIYGSGSGATITQQVPLIYPWNPKLYAQGMSFSAATSDTLVTLARPFASAVVRVEFGTFPYQLGDGSKPWVSIRASGSSDMITLPGIPFSFSTGEKIEQDIGRIVGMVAFEITRYQVPDFDQWVAVATPLLGCVNSAPFTVSKTTFAAGSMLFPTFGLDSQTSFLGTPQNQVSIPVIYRALNWNYGMRSDGVYDAITPSPYPVADLSPLVN